MRAVVQRVSSASVTIDGKVKSAIGPGLLILLGIGHEDGQEDIDYLVKKIAGVYGTGMGNMEGTSVADASDFLEEYL